MVRKRKMLGGEKGCNNGQEAVYQPVAMEGPGRGNTQLHLKVP